MRVSSLVRTALVAAVFCGFAARPASAEESFQLCLQLDAPGTHQYFLNFGIQGRAVFVGGMKGHGGEDDHGPVTGSMSRTPLPSYGFEMALMVALSNGGDYAGPNTETVVFHFNPNGSIGYKRWLDRDTAFTQGTSFVIACPV
jgi:hypothetical protein